MTGGVPMFDKVRKLLAKAESPACPPAEAEALTAKATELIAKYGIDSALLVADHPEADRVQDRAVRIHPPYASEKARLLQVVAKGMRCRAVALQRRANGVRQFSAASSYCTTRCWRRPATPSRSSGCRPGRIRPRGAGRG
jgi:hypothetical protein